MDAVHVAIAEVLLKLLKENKDNALIPYGDLCDQIGNMIIPRNTAGYLSDLSNWCHEFGAPMISVLVVNQREYMAGNGFFELYEQEYGIKVVDKEKVFRDELKKVRSYDAWQEFAEYLGLDYIFKE